MNTMIGTMVEAAGASGVATGLANFSVLSVLKYTGIAITCTSTVWAGLARLSYQDEQGRKRLTISGYASIAFVIAGALIATLSYGFENAAKSASEMANAQEHQRRDNAAVAQRALEQQREDSRRLTDRIADEARAYRQALLINTRAQQSEALQRFIAQRERFQRLEESQRQTARLTREISRTVLTLDGTHVSVSITTDLSRSRLAGYEQRLLDAWRDDRLPTHREIARSNTDFDEIIVRQILFPVADEDIAYHTPSRPRLIIKFHLTNGEDKELFVQDIQTGRRRFVNTWIQYDRHERHLTALLWRMPLSEMEWEAESGPIRSLPDLLGAQISIELESSRFISEDRNEELLADELTRRMALGAILLDTPSFGQICLPSAAMRQGTLQPLRRIYFITLPRSLDELRALLSPNASDACRELASLSLEA